MGSMFQAAKQPLPFETASDRLNDALARFNQPKTTVVEADHVMTKTEAEALIGPPNYPTFSARSLPMKPVEHKPKIVWETIDGKRVPRRID